MLFFIFVFQCVGKSTTLKELQKRGWVVDDFKVSRSVQNELGWESLTRAEENAVDMVALQEAILTHKHQHDEHLAKHSTVFLTERTFADIVAYASLWVWKLIDADKWVANEAMAWHREYIKKCREAQLIYSGVILLPYMDHMPWENDPYRAKKSDISRVYEDVESFANQFAIPKLIIDTQTVDARVVQIENFLNKTIGI